MTRARIRSVERRLAMAGEGACATGTCATTRRTLARFLAAGPTDAERGDSGQHTARIGLIPPEYVQGCAMSPRGPTDAAVRAPGTPPDVPAPDSLAPNFQAPDLSAPDDRRPTGGRETAVPVRRHSRRVAVLAVVVLLLVELVVGWPWIVSAFESFQTPVWTWFGLALVAAVASMGAYTRMQRRLLRVGGTAVSLPSAAALAYASHSLSDTLPGGPAFSAVFSFRRMRRLGASAGVASWVIAFSGAISAAALVLIGAVAGLLATGSTDTAALVSYATAGALLLLAVRAVSRRPGVLTRSATRVVRLANRVLRHEPHRGAARVHGLIAEVTAVRIGPRDLLITAGFAVVNWLLDAVSLYLCLVAVGVDHASPVAVLLAYTAGMAALSVPVVPGGLGVVDAALVLGLVAGGTSPTDAIAATILFRVITLGVIIGAGWVVWWFTRHRHAPTPRSGVIASDLLATERQVGQGPDGLEQEAEHPGPA